MITGQIQWWHIGSVIVLIAVAFYVMSGFGGQSSETQEGSDVSVAKSDFVGGAVTISFDDAWDSQFDHALPVLLEYDYPAMFYILTDTVVGGDYGYMNEAEVQALARLGFEIGAHTRTHPDLTTLSPEELKDELEQPKQYLESLVSQPVTSLAYPLGKSNETVIAAVQAAGYRDGRSAGQGIERGFNKLGQDIFTYGSFSPNGEVTMDEMKAAIDEAVARDLWFVFSFHQVGQYEGEYDTPPEDFEEIVAYINQSGVEVIGIEEGVSRLAVAAK